MKSINPQKGYQLKTEIKKLLTFRDINHNLFTKLITKFNWLESFFSHIPFIFQENTTECIVIDYLISGNNPIINSLLLNNIMTHHENEKIRIGLIQPENYDYWGYHVFENNTEEAESIFSLLNLLVNKENIEIILIKNNVHIETLNKIEDTYILRMKKESTSNHFIYQEMPHIIHSLNNIKRNYLHRFFNIIHNMDNVYSLSFLKNKDSMIISKNVWLSSFQNTIQKENIVKELEYHQKKLLITEFVNNLDVKYFASAKYFPHQFIDFHETLCMELVELKKYDI